MASNEYKDLLKLYNRFLGQTTYSYTTTDTISRHSNGISILLRDDPSLTLAAGLRPQLNLRPLYAAAMVRKIEIEIGVGDEESLYAWHGVS